MCLCQLLGWCLGPVLMATLEGGSRLRCGVCLRIQRRCIPVGLVEVPGNLVELFYNLQVGRGQCTPRASRPNPAPASHTHALPLCVPSTGTGRPHHHSPPPVLRRVSVRVNCRRPSRALCLTLRPCAPAAYVAYVLVLRARPPTPAPGSRGASHRCVYPGHPSGRSCVGRVPAKQRGGPCDHRGFADVIQPAIAAP